MDYVCTRCGTRFPGVPIPDPRFGGGRGPQQHYGDGGFCPNPDCLFHGGHVTMGWARRAD